MTWANGAQSNAKTAYDYEVGANKINKTYEAKIGMMYLSEYYYGSLPTHWTKPGFDGTSGGGTRDYRSAVNDNWIYMGFYEWTISPYTDSTNYAFGVYVNGYVRGNDMLNSLAVRPTFSLVPSVELASGTGTKADPYRIS